MQITDILAQMGGLQSVARDLGVDEAQVATGAQALVPAILGGFKKQAQAQPAGLDGLGGLLGQMGGDSLLDQVLAPQPTDVTAGNEVLGQIFGSKDVSRAVAQNAAAQSGLSPELLKKMLPLVAMLVTGFMARQQGGGACLGPVDAAPAGGGLGSGIGGGMGGGLGDALGGMLGGMLGGGGLGPGAGAARAGAGGLGAMLDLNGDGNPLDDILRMAGKAMG